MTMSQVSDLQALRTGVDLVVATLRFCFLFSWYCVS
jgi:hypothetical protein